jgi:two-component system chemotaxis response regulator CheB
MLVKEAVNGDMIKPGLVLIAPGDKHLRVEKSGSGFRVKISDEDKVCGHRPSVEVLMLSMAKHVGANSIGIMLSGMGSDGAYGMLAMRQAGARTVAQDEATSVVYGMPKEAFQCGGAESLMPLQKIAAEVMRLLS